MSNDLAARIAALKSTTETVPVGELELVLRKPKLGAYGAFMEAVGAIDPEPLLAAGLPILMSAFEAGDGVAFLRAIAENGAAIWRAVTSNLGDAAAKAIARGVAALLDTAENHGRLVAASQFKAGTMTSDEQDGGYLESAALRAWVARNIEVDQALFVVERAWALARLADAGKALAAGMKTRLVGKAPVNGTPVPTPPAPATPTNAAG